VFYEEQGTSPGTCTHKEAFKEKKAAVKECKETSYEDCKLKPNCQQNFDEAPSSEAGACTHLDMYRTKEEKVKLCKTLSSE